MAKEEGGIGRLGNKARKMYKNVYEMMKQGRQTSDKSKSVF